MTKQLPTVYFNEEDVKTIKEAILPREATEADLKLFLAQSKRTGLDPLSRQIYAFKQAGKLVIGTTIDGARVVAERTSKYAGQVGPFWCGEDGNWKDVWLEKGPPAAAKVGILRIDFKETLWAVALYSGYQGQGIQWQKNAANMLAKCAEQLALRKAFPNDLSGLYGKEELGNDSEQVVESESKPLSQVESTAKSGSIQVSPGKSDQKGNRQKQTISAVEPATKAGSPITASEVAFTNKQDWTEDKANAGNTVATLGAAGAVTEIVDISETVTDTTISAEDLMGVLNLGLRNGYAEEEISQWIESTFNVTEATVLELTKSQLGRSDEALREEDSMSKQTIEQLKQSPTYRYIKQLTYAFDNAGVEGEPMELPFRAVMEAPLPDYLPVSAAIKCKFLFILSVYTNAGRIGGMMDTVNGTINMIMLCMEEKE